MSNAREKYMLALTNLVNGSELGYEDRSSIPQYKKDIEDYVESLEEKNQKYKEVIDKIKECINEFPIIHYSSIEKVNKKRLSGKLIPVDELLDILKEVE